MSGLPWVRLDTAFPYNPKVLAMVAERDGHRAVAVYLCGLAYAGGHGTDGLIASQSLAVIHGRRVDAARLVAHGFWIPDVGGWLINGWHEKQMSGEEYQQRRKKAQDAARARWDKKAKAEAEATG